MRITSPSRPRALGGAAVIALSVVTSTGLSQAAGAGGGTGGAAGGAGTGTGGGTGTVGGTAGGSNAQPGVTNQSDQQLQNQVTRKGKASTYGGVAGTGLGGSDNGALVGTMGTGNSVQGPPGQGITGGSQTGGGGQSGAGTSSDSGRVGAGSGSNPPAP
jgi:hypothetical protein